MAVTGASDVRAAAELAGRCGAAVTSLVRDVHLAVAHRVFRFGGSATNVPKLAHDLYTGAVYATVGAGIRTAAATAGFIAANRVAADSHRIPLPDRSSTQLVVGALNGAWGDRLSQWHNGLALAMALRHDGRDLSVHRAALEQAYPSATGDVVLFVPGLCETDRSWRLAAADHYGDPAATHGSRLQRELALTPLYLRYNTGLRIHDNGRLLSALLTDLVREWPVPVDRLTLIGHSMGGLVIRAACRSGLEHDEPWLPVARRMVYLGSPHLGAPLERAASVATTALMRLPETRPFASALASRSAAIKDLHYGTIDDVIDDHRPEPEQCPPLLASAEHCAIGATLSRQRDSRSARLIGDVLVPYPSACGADSRRGIGLDARHARHVGGLHHLDLLNHPRAYALLRDWLADTATAR